MPSARLVSSLRLVVVVVAGEKQIELITERERENNLIIMEFHQLPAIETDDSRQE